MTHNRHNYLVGITWREANTGRVKTERRPGLRALWRAIMSRQVSNRLLLCKLVVAALLCAVAVFAACMWLDGWQFAAHKAAFWARLGRALFAH